MKKSHFSDEQIVKILSSATGGATVRKVCQSHEGSENTFYTWKRKVAGMESDDIRKLKAHQSENQALKQILAGRALLRDATVKLYRKNGLCPRPKVGGPLPDFCLTFRNARHVSSSVLPGVALICH